jgi:dihydroflavonol-4-reductase
LTFLQIAKALKRAYPQRKIATAKAPTMLIRMLALFDEEIKSSLPLLGKVTPATSAKAASILGITFIPAEQSIRETADFLIQSGVLKG